MASENNIYSLNVSATHMIVIPDVKASQDGLLRFQLSYSTAFLSWHPFCLANCPLGTLNWCYPLCRWVSWITNNPEEHKQMSIPDVTLPLVFGINSSPNLPEPSPCTHLREDLPPPQFTKTTVFFVWIDHPASAQEALYPQTIIRAWAPGPVTLPVPCLVLPMWPCEASFNVFSPGLWVISFCISISPVVFYWTIGTPGLSLTNVDLTKA